MPGTLREDIALTLKCPTGRASEQRGPGETHPLFGVTVQMGHLEPRGGALPRHTARVSLRESSHADAQPSRDSPKGRVSLQREKKSQLQSTAGCLWVLTASRNDPWSVLFRTPARAVYSVGRDLLPHWVLKMRGFPGGPVLKDSMLPLQGRGSDLWMGN